MNRTVGICICVLMIVACVYALHLRSRPEEPEELLWTKGDPNSITVGFVCGKCGKSIARTVVGGFDDDKWCPDCVREVLLHCYDCDGEIRQNCPHKIKEDARAVDISGITIITDDSASITYNCSGNEANSTIKWE